jgi:hypothetical protein
VVSFYLPDSTRVWLNANSSLTYFDNYGEENRKTRLSGEGYFKVKRDEAQPFVVNTAEAMVNVLGTSFNVKEDSTGAIILTVAEGKVKFSLVEEAEGIVVERNEQAVAIKGTSLIKTTNADPAFAHWRRIRNPEFVKEQEHPDQYIDVIYSWRKTSSFKSIIKGTLTNQAHLSDYQHVVLKISMVNAKGKMKVTRRTIPDIISSGRSVSFELPLEIQANTHHLTVEIEKAETVH